MRFSRWSESPSGDPTGPPSSPEAAPRRSRAVRLRVLILLVAACAAILSAMRVVRDTFSPTHQWARLVRDGTTEQRRLAAGELGRVDPGQVAAALPALARAIGDVDERVAVLAANALVEALQRAPRRGDPVRARLAIAALITGLEDPRPNVRLACAEALSTPPGPALHGTEAASAVAVALASALGDSSEVVRRAAAMALRSLGSASSDPPPEALRVALDRDPSASVRAAAALALGQFSAELDRTTIDLLHALGTDDADVRKACDNSLMVLGGNRAAGTPRRSAALVPALIEALSSDERMVRFHAARILGETGTSALESVPALLRLLQEPLDAGKQPPDRRAPDFWDPAGQAAHALGTIAPRTPRAEEVVAALLTVVCEGSPDQRRAQAAHALTAFGPEVTAPHVPLLIRLLDETVDRNGPPAPAFCFALGRIAPNSRQAEVALAVLSKALASSWDETRSAAAMAIARFGARARTVLPRLRALQKNDGLSFVRESARMAATQIETSAEPKEK